MDNRWIKRALQITLVSIVAGVCTAGSVYAADYPYKPVRLMVPFPPGGGADIVARVVGMRLSNLWNQQVIIDNRGGAGGVIGTELVARAQPDGYTILFGSQSTIAMNPAMYKNLNFDPVKDFIPVILVAYSPQLLAVHPSVEAKTLQEFIALAKASPGKLNYASSGIGTSGHLTFELFKRAAGNIDVLHVPYKGTAAALNDFLGGQVKALMGSTAVTLPLMKAGRLRTIAIATATRSPAMPQLPTMAESGLPGFEVKPWFGLLFPARTPKVIVDKLFNDVRKLQDAPELAKGIEESGAVAADRESQKQFATLVASEQAMWKKVVQEVIPESMLPVR